MEGEYILKGDYHKFSWLNLFLVCLAVTYKLPFSVYASKGVQFTKVNRLSSEFLLYKISNIYQLPFREYASKGVQFTKVNRLSSEFLLYKISKISATI